MNSETQHEVCCDLLLKLPQPSEYFIIFVSILSAVHVRHALLMDFEYVPLTRLFFLLVFRSLSLANDGIGTCTVSN